MRTKTSEPMEESGVCCIALSVEWAGETTVVKSCVETDEETGAEVVDGAGGELVDCVDFDGVDFDGVDFDGVDFDAVDCVAAVDCTFVVSIVVVVSAATVVVALIGLVCCTSLVVKYAIDLSLGNDW